MKGNDVDVSFRHVTPFVQIILSIFPSRLLINLSPSKMGPRLKVIYSNRRPIWVHSAQALAVWAKFSRQSEISLARVKGARWGEREDCHWRGVFHFTLRSPLMTPHSGQQMARQMKRGRSRGHALRRHNCHLLRAAARVESFCVDKLIRFNTAIRLSRTRLYSN